MPRGDKGKRFEKGNRTSLLGGRPKMDPELKELRQMDRSDLEKVIREASQLTRDQIKKKLNDPEVQIKERIALRIMLRGDAEGDQQVFQFISDFLFGKLPDKVYVKNVQMEGELTPEMLKQSWDEFNKKF